MIKKLQRRFALSRKGAIDTIKGSLFCALQNVAFMLPVGLLYLLVKDMLSGSLEKSRIPFFIVGCIVCAAIILITTRLQYNSTFLATYVETGVRRINLAEKLRKIPLSFFGKKRPCGFDLGHYERLRRAGNQPVAPGLPAYRLDNFNNGHSCFAVCV